MRFFVILTPCILLSFKGEGEDVFKRAPPLKPLAK